MQDIPLPEAPVEIAAPVPSDDAREGSAPVAKLEEETAEPPIPIAERDDGTLVIDLTALAPPHDECLLREPDPFNPEIIVCRERGDSPRLGPRQGPVLDNFGNAIPRARLRLSDNAEAEANVIKKSVGGFDADGAEIKVKIDF